MGRPRPANPARARRGLRGRSRVDLENLLHVTQGRLLMPRGHGVGSKATQFLPIAGSLRERFNASYIPEPNSGCWLWEAGGDNKGYGRITIAPRKPMRLAHRISWELHHGRPAVKFILHHCDNTYCVNPEHLYEGTQKDNMRDRSVRNRMPDLRGEKGPNAKLTSEQVVLIRADSRSQRLIATEYGVSQATISLIKLRKHWGHV
jgi:HNH endonuclease